MLDLKSFFRYRSKTNSQKILLKKILETLLPRLEKGLIEGSIHQGMDETKEIQEESRKASVAVRQTMLRNNITD